MKRKSLLILLVLTAIVLSGCGNKSDESMDVAGVTLNKENTFIDVGGSEQLIATITPANAANQNVSWSSSNESVATVTSGGLVTMISVGSVIITVTTADGGFTATCEIYSAYKIIYNGNGNTGGDVPIDENLYSSGDIVTVIENSGNLEKNGYNFGGWNTEKTGNGTTYSVSETFTMNSADATLYAKWNINELDTAITYRLSYIYGSITTSYSNIYIIWVENISENFYYPIYVCNRLLGIGGALTNTALPYWKVKKYPYMGYSEVNAVTGATLKQLDFDLSFNLPAGAPRQFTIYFETDVSFNGNDWFADQPAILYKAVIDQDNIQSEYTLTYCGWTANEGTVESKSGVPGAVFGELNAVLGYITNLDNGSGGFGDFDSRSQTNLVNSITVYVNQ